MVALPYHFNEVHSLHPLPVEADLRDAEDFAFGIVRMISSIKADDK
jgi:hypothetical protein